MKTKIYYGYYLTIVPYTDDDSYLSINFCPECKIPVSYDSISASDCPNPVCNIDLSKYVISKEKVLYPEPIELAMNYGLMRCQTILSEDLEKEGEYIYLFKIESPYWTEITINEIGEMSPAGYIDEKMPDMKTFKSEHFKLFQYLNNIVFEKKIKFGVVVYYD